MVEQVSSRERADAPAPDSAQKPQWPTEVKKPAWGYVFRKALREFSSDGCIDIAASLTYYAVLSLFPALLALVSLLGVFGQGRQATDALLSVVAEVAPQGTVDVVREPLEQFSTSPAAGWALLTGVVLAIWSASGYVGAFARGMNRIYEIDEGRPFWKLKPQQLLVTLIGIVLILIIAIILAVSGPVTEVVGEALGLGEAVQAVWSIAKWVLLAAILVLMVAILYYATPNVKQPKFRWMSFGALIALITIGVASVLFGLYVANFSNYDRTYGSLAGVIVFLLWLWMANLALLFGAEFDSEVERARQLQAGMQAEEVLQLPPRDTSKSDKADKKEEEIIRRGRELRERYGDEPEGSTSASRSNSDRGDDSRQK